MHDTPSTLNSVFFKKHDVFAHPHYAFEKKKISLKIDARV